MANTKCILCGEDKMFTVSAELDILSDSIIRRSRDYRFNCCEQCWEHLEILTCKITKEGLAYYSEIASNLT